MPKMVERGKIVHKLSCFICSVIFSFSFFLSIFFPLKKFKDSRKLVVGQQTNVKAKKYGFPKTTSSTADIEL